MTTVLVIGASGKSGTAIVAAALAAGHTVHGLVRNRSKAAHLPGPVILFDGDGRDPAALEPALAGVDAVIVPAGGLKDPVTAEIIRALEPLLARHGIGRIIVLSAYGAIDGRGFYGWLMRTSAAAVVTDKAETERLLRASKLDWTAVRPGVLTDGPATGRVKAAEHAVLKGLPRISRADVASFIIGELAQPRFVRRSPVVSI